MGRKKGEWVKPREKPRYTPEGKAAVKEQHSKVAKAGELIKERCTGKKGSDFKRCRHDVMKEVFGKKDEETKK